MSNDHVVADLTLPPGGRAYIRFGHRGDYVISLQEITWPKTGRARLILSVNQANGSERLRAEVNHTYPKWALAEDGGEPEPESVAPDAGWGWHVPSKKSHYFHQTRSLCGEWVSTGPLSVLPGSTNPDDCKDCTRRLAERVVPKTKGED